LALQVNDGQVLLDAEELATRALHAEPAAS
jgi:hypothetical protein